MSDTYAETRDRLETYFDRTASATWARLTSDAPVSYIRRTVRQGRDRMRNTLLSGMPEDLTGARVLDAGCGVGQVAVALAERGADVVATDISPSLLEVARKRTPADLERFIHYVPGDMLDTALGTFDYVVAMDSLIHYRPADIARSLTHLAARTRSAILFTIAPKTPLLSAMHLAGKAFPRSDRSPAIVPTSHARLRRALDGMVPTLDRRDRDWNLSRVDRISSGFYISEAMEMRR